MTKNKKHIILLIILTIVFYATGQLAYEHIYRMTIKTVQLFANGQIGFFGKFPFWFFGYPTFGLIFGSIPLTFFLTQKLLLRDFSNKFGRTFMVYILFFIAAYFFFCCLQSIQLTVSNDFIKEGEMFHYAIRNVNLNVIFLLTIVAATVLTNLTLLLLKWISKHRHATSLWTNFRADLNLHIFGRRAWLQITTSLPSIFA